MPLCESFSLEDTIQFGKRFANNLKPGSTLALLGDLGAGKTTLIKTLAKEFGSYELVSSPTFNYLNIYEGSLTLYHFDLYRLEKPEDFLQKGFNEYLHAQGICLIEWAEKITSYLPENTLFLKIESLSPTSRRFSW